VADLIGKTLSHFKITGKLGEGGMGEVYRAIDTTLDREVAIKLLPDEVASDSERLARFEREAKVLASLNHSNISSIYGLEGAEDKRFLVLELVEGETLEERIKRGPVPLEEALELARQMVDGIEAAHEKGIVHRDLKPANVKVTPQGQVKVLDFGLAKALDTAPMSSGSEPLLSQSPTLTAQMTVAGVLLGTAAYMSPEQARGDVVDERSDVWSFGVVLFEMLAGKSVYSGGTVSDVLAGILAREPEWDDLPEELPISVRRLLERCLDKDIRERYQAIGEVRIALRNFSERLDESAIEVDPQLSVDSPRKARSTRWLLATLALGLLAAVGAWWNASRPVEEPLISFSVGPPPDGSILVNDRVLLDVSPDGRRLVFVASTAEGEHQLYLRNLDSQELKALAGTGGALDPFFSPDGNWIGFSTDNELKRVAVSGGVPLVLAKMGISRGGTWLPDGTIVFTEGTSGGLVRISAEGGEPETLTELDDERNERTHRWPSALPDGSAVLFTSDTYETTEFYDDARIEAVSTETGRRVVVLEGTSKARYLAPDQLIFARDGSLFTVPFDLRKLQVTGSPKLVLQEVLTDVSSGAVQFAVSAVGTFSYVSGQLMQGSRSLAWVDRSGAVENVGIEEGNYQEVRLSPDHRRAVVNSNSSSGLDIWVVDLERSTMNRLTFAGTNIQPAWSPDGTMIAYGASLESGNYKPYWKPASGSGEAELLWDTDQQAFPRSFSPDGEFLMLNVDGPNGRSDLWSLSMVGERQAVPFLTTPANELMPSFSPDGRWIAYASDESGRAEIYVTAFPRAAGKWQVSRNGGWEPLWAEDGRRLYYRGRGNMMVEVEIETTSTVVIGPERVLFSGTLGGPLVNTYSIGKGAERFLLLRASSADDQTPAEISIYLNWVSNLNKLLGAGG
jgi:serine/threonine protein kinase